MNDLVVLRPQRIATMRESMEELGRAGGLMRDALTESNDAAHQTFFAPVLERLDMIVANEREGLTQFIADDLDGLRSAIRRIRLSDIDAALQMPTQALKVLRGALGNLTYSIDTALEAAAELGLRAANSAGGQLIVASRDVTEHLIRLDERLRTVQQTVGDLQEAAVLADRVTNNAVNVGLVHFCVQTMKVELSAARFETKIGSDNEIATGADLNVLTRSIENIREIAGDLGMATVVMREWMAARVAAAGELVVKAANRAYAGLKTVVSAVRKKLASKKPLRPRIFHEEVLEGAIALDHVSDYPPTDLYAAQIQPVGGIESQEAHGDTHFIASPPADFDLAEVHAMILRGETPKASWRPFVKKLSFRGEREFSDLSPLSGLSELTKLWLNSTQVSDLSPLSGLSGLTELCLNSTKVSDLSPLSDLSGLTALWLSSTQVSDLSPLSGLSGLTALSLSSTEVSDLSPLSGLSGLTELSLSSTEVSDLSPLSGLSGLTTLWLSSTQVSDLSPLSGLSGLTELVLDSTQVSDLSPLSGLSGLTELDLDSTQVSDLSPLSGLKNLSWLSLGGSGVSLSLPSTASSGANLILELSQEIDLRPLAGLTHLKALCLKNMLGTVDLSSLSGLYELDELHLEGTEVYDISVLDHLKHLTLVGGRAPRKGKPRPLPE
jgi:Leucine-rich repeat (LRR) protein